MQHTHTKREGEQVSRLMRLVYRRVFLLRQEVYHVAHKEQDWKHMGNFYNRVSKGICSCVYVCVCVCNFGKAAPPL